ncbi:DNA-directed RNA polymerase [Aspergillus flavus]|nr:DNA-directed RNA polymerase [Aspergillus flavus]
MSLYPFFRDYFSRVVQYCDDCGSLLDESPEETLQCELCGKLAKNTVFFHTQTTASENFPSKLRNKMKSFTQKATRDELGPGPTIEVDCVKCPSKDVTYSQVQLRSADEGSTIFYNCLKCGHRQIHWLLSQA